MLFFQSSRIITKYYLLLCFFFLILFIGLFLIVIVWTYIPCPISVFTLKAFLFISSNKFTSKSPCPLVLPLVENLSLPILVTSISSSKELPIIISHSLSEFKYTSIPNSLASDFNDASTALSKNTPKIFPRHFSSLELRL